MVGVRRKPPELLVNRRGGRGRKLVVVAPAGRPVPKPPTGLAPHAREVWRKFWTSPVSAAVDVEADWEALTHWIACVDERDRLNELAVKQPLIPGSKHTKERPHLVLNPLFRRIEALSDEIRRAEEAFGMTPLARFRLQLTFAEAGNSSMTLRQRLLAAAGNDDPMPDFTGDIVDGEAYG